MGRLLSRQEILELFPGIDKDNLTGGVVFCDGQMYNPPRLAISFLRSAVNNGAEAANYLEVTGFLQRENRVFGIKARDLMSDNELEIRGRIVLNTTGPWAHRLLVRELGLELNPKPVFSRDLALVTKRRTENKYGIAFPTKTRDADSFFDRGGRHLFALPWRECTLIGVWHKIFNQRPEKIRVTENELHGFINEVNEANPSLALTIDDISIVNTGLTLFGSENSQPPQKMSFGKRSRLIDHYREHRLKGIVTLIGVRATTAQVMAEKAIDLIFSKWGVKGPKSRIRTSPIYGGRIGGSFERFVQEAIECNRLTIDAEAIRSLIHNYGSQYLEVLKYVDEEPTLAETIGSTRVLKAEVLYAVRDEMAHKLTDVVFRRTDLGTAGHPGEAALRTCAKLMSAEMGWDEERTQDELCEVTAAYPRLG
jgi:glycerol-3-phosphate dehydrogenase